MKYHIIHLAFTDGCIHIQPCQSVEEVKDYIKEKRIHKDDVRIISGGEEISLSSLKSHKKKQKI